MGRLAAVLVGALAFMAAGAVPAFADWRVVRTVDEFTDVASCRVEPGGVFSRGMLPGIRYFFFFERRGEETRLGVTTDYGLPINGDLQLRIDDGEIVTITASDTPLDLVPRTAVAGLQNVAPAARANVEATVANIMVLGSPYRVIAGARAEVLLGAILRGRRTIWRTVGINAASSGTGEIEPTRSLRRRLTQCGIRAVD